MSDAAIIEYRGFTVRPLVREYTFSVREVAVEPREYTLTILNEAFNSHRARYQDAPDICSLRIRRELAANSNHPAETHYRITDAEIDEYRASHAPKAAHNRHTPKATQDS